MSAKSRTAFHTVLVDDPQRTELHVLRIWIQPQQLRLPPSYEQKAFAAAEKRGRLRLIAAPDGAAGAVLIHQDARIYAGLFAPGERARYELPPGRRAWLHLARGALNASEVQLAGGDGAYTQGPALIDLHDGADAEVLLFDLPG